MRLSRNYQAWCLVCLTVLIPGVALGDDASDREAIYLNVFNFQSAIARDSNRPTADRHRAIRVITSAAVSKFGEAVPASDKKKRNLTTIAASHLVSLTLDRSVAIEALSGLEETLSKKPGNLSEAGFKEATSRLAQSGSIHVVREQRVAAAAIRDLISNSDTSEGKFQVAQFKRYAEIARTVALASAADTMVRVTVTDALVKKGDAALQADADAAAAQKAKETEVAAKAALAAAQRKALEATSYETFAKKNADLVRQTTDPTQAQVGALRAALADAVKRELLEKLPDPGPDDKLTGEEVTEIQLVEQRAATAKTTAEAEQAAAKKALDEASAAAKEKAAAKETDPKALNIIIDELSTIALTPGLPNTISALATQALKNFLLGKASSSEATAKINVRVHTAAGADSASPLAATDRALVSAMPSVTSRLAGVTTTRAYDAARDGSTGGLRGPRRAAPPQSLRRQRGGLTGTPRAERAVGASGATGAVGITFEPAQLPTAAPPASPPSDQGNSG